MLLAEILQVSIWGLILGCCKLAKHGCLSKVKPASTDKACENQLSIISPHVAVVGMSSACTTGLEFDGHVSSTIRFGGSKA